MIKSFVTTLSLVLLLLVFPVTAQEVVFSDGTIDTSDFTFEPPPEKSTLLDLEVDDTGEIIQEGVGLDIRLDAMKEAALSYGARGGLAWRTYEIRQELHQQERYLQRVFDFRQLLIPAPSGFLIEPPVISESENNVLVDGGGQEAAVTDRFYNINTNVRIVTAPRTWRQYLEREWGEVIPPPNVLRPQNNEERMMWKSKVRQGWDAGIEQADEIFESDLNQLLRDYRGMVRYRKLLAQGIVSPTLAIQTDRGITGGGDELRIGDRAVQIVDQPQLIPESSQWVPGNR